MSGIEHEKIIKDSRVSRSDLDRFCSLHRIYLETSTFNEMFERFDLNAFEITREYQRRQGVIFVASPVLLWEIMLVGDRDRADRMLLAAQLLFDSVLLATPAELIVRFLETAYPKNTVNYSFFSELELAPTWSQMTTDWRTTFEYDLEALKAKTSPFRLISKNLNAVIEGQPCGIETVDLAAQFVAGIHLALREDLEHWGIEATTAKFVILYVFLLLLMGADLAHDEVNRFWTRLGYGAVLSQEQVTRVFIDFPEIFRYGPLLEMATMAALQFDTRRRDRGILHDGMHMIYAPYVNAILSSDPSFSVLSKDHPFYRGKVYHM